MVKTLLSVTALALIAVLVYVRILSRRHVSALIRSTVTKLAREGTATEDALREVINKLRRRSPFNRIQDDEIILFLDLLHDLGSPIAVAAEMLQECELRYNVSDFKDPQKILKTSYLKDLEINLRAFLETAIRLQRRAAQKFPNITIALLACLSQREGWSFEEEQANFVIFRYRNELVQIAKQNSGKDVSRIVLFEEIKGRPVKSGDDDNLRIRQQGRQDLVDKFEDHFNNAFQKVAEL